MVFSMRFASALFFGLLSFAAAGVAPALSASLEGLAVEVKNESEPVLCAEKDNVSLSFTNDKVRSFRIEAAHPVYLTPGMRGNFEADWTACDTIPEPGYKAPAPPRKITLLDGNDLWVIGYTFPTFWRPSRATVRIGDRSRRAFISCRSGCCAPTARRKCWCSIRRTAIGGRDPCRPTASATPAMAPPS